MVSIICFAQPEIQWSRAYGGDHRETCRQVIQLPDGGYALCGFRDYYERQDRSIYDFYVVRTDSSGQKLWDRNFGGHLNDYGYSILLTDESEFLIAGNSRSFGAGREDGLLIKLDMNGDSLWSRTYGDQNSNYFHKIKAIPGDGYVICGNSNSRNGSLDGWLVRIDSGFEVMWQQYYGGEGTEGLGDLIHTNDNGFLMVGSTRSFGAGGADFYVVKVDSTGEVEWEESYGTELTDACQSVVQTADGGYALAGFSGETIGPNGPLDSWVVRVNANGEVLWERTYDWMDYGYKDRFYSIIQTEDGGFACAGYASTLHMNDYYLVRINENGDILWFTNLGGNGSETCYSVISTFDGGYALGGQGDGQGEGLDEFWLVKTGADPVNVPYLLDPAFPSSLILHTPYPNPFNSTTRIAFQLPYPSHVTLSIHDQQGREVTVLLNQNLTPGTHEVRWQADNQPSGMYYCMMDADGFRISKGVVFVR